jgi:acyl-CoA synthetase (AMP-forming)/AMP-acid ligase II
VDRERLAMGQRPLDPNGATEVVESGRALEGVEIEIFDENRAKVADGIVGEIGLSGDFLFTEYNAEPERTRAQLQDGIFYSRDLGFRHEGCLYVLGRKDDVIIVNGRKLFAHEVEEALTRIVGIRPGRAVAASLPSERTGTGELVIIAERDPAAPRDEAAIRGDIVTTVFSIFAVQPKAVALREPGSLVKTTSGKISRGVNLARYLAEQV